MVLVDRSLWVEHLRRAHADLEALLCAGKVVCHRFVIGELACGCLDNRAEIFSLLRSLPSAVEADLMKSWPSWKKYRLMGKGLGLIDMHLMASAFLSGTPLWTLDKKLRRESVRLGVAY